MGQQTTSYRGRVFAEVWMDGHVRTAWDDDALLRPALAAIQASVGNAESLAGRVPSTPSMGDRNESTFLGLVAVDIWRDHTKVGFTGSGFGQIRTHAMNELRSLLAKPSNAS
jgi:hypothetical protein